MSDAEKPALDHDAGDEPRRTRGSYTYKNGDWTYEELAGHRARLLADERTVWGALGFQDTHMVTADEVADKALALIARVRDAERERDELRAKIARAVKRNLRGTMTSRIRARVISS